ncbi:MAG TPA: FKBP-type peptidyl-prolyl cis-trans isomerase [Candidatus Lokiarchaeia archaeon]|nr:FKBP-type peptidyl-prolyl cis-trans isomerase [Candidatus Lokiarchaeia archaeon]
MTEEIKTDDVVRIHLTGRVNSFEGPVFQVTDEAVAKAEGIADEEKDKHSHYEPKLVIVGKKQVIDGVDEALVGMTVGEEKNVEIPPEKAFGLADPKKRRVMALREYRIKFKKAPRVGDSVELPQTREQARIVRIDQGKVVLDTNHMLADRIVYYTIKVIEKMEGEDAKLNAMIEQRMPGIPTSEFKIAKVEGALEITLPSQVSFYQQSGFMQYLLAMEIQKEFTQYEKVRFIIEFEKPKVPEQPVIPEAGEGIEALPANTSDETETLESDSEVKTGAKKAKRAPKKAKKVEEIDAPAEDAPAEETTE